MLWFNQSELNVNSPLNYDAKINSPICHTDVRRLCFCFNNDYLGEEIQKMEHLLTKSNSILTCSAGDGHSNFFDFNGEETLAHLSSLMFFRKQKEPRA